MGVQVVDKETQENKHSAGNMAMEGVTNKKTWVKLTGPAAKPLAEAFLEPAVVVLQEIMTGDEEERKAHRKRECLMKVSPTMIFMTRQPGVRKNIKVLKSYRIVLLGNTGAGKSSLANTIFEEDVFKINQAVTCGTGGCQTESRSVHGRRITLTDTSGFRDTDRPEEDMMRWISEFTPGPHVFLIVLKMGKEQEIIAKICKYFPEEAFKYTAVVFTHGEQLPKGMKIEEFVEQNQCLSALIKKCGSRCHVVDNEDWKNNKQADYRSNKVQVETLLNTIDKMVMENKGSCFTTEMLQASRREREDNSNMTSAGNTPQSYSSNTDVNRLCRNVWLKLTGPAAESLAEGLLGPNVIVWKEEHQGGGVGGARGGGGTAGTKGGEAAGVTAGGGGAAGTQGEGAGEPGGAAGKVGGGGAALIAGAAVIAGAAGGGGAAGIAGALVKARVGGATGIAGGGETAGGGGATGGGGGTGGEGATGGGGAAGGVGGAVKAGAAVVNKLWWLLQTYYKFKDLFKVLEQNSSVILSVVAFYSLLLLSFVSQDPIIETLLLMCGVLLWLLLTVD